MSCHGISLIASLFNFNEMREDERARFGEKMMLCLLLTFILFCVCVWSTGVFIYINKQACMYVYIYFVYKAFHIYFILCTVMVDV
jgi:hypothetical protein